MKTHSTALIWICIVLTVVCLVWSGFNSVMYMEVAKLFTSDKVFVNFMTVGIIVFFLSHLVIILYTIFSLKNSQLMLNAGIILIILGVISLISLLLNFIAFDQLTEDFHYGDPYSSMLKLAMITQLSLIFFFLYSLIYFIILRRTGDKFYPTKSVSREQIFIAMNITGIVCSVAGILLVLFYSRAYHIVRISIVYKILPYCIVLLPYLLSLTGWGIRYYRDRRLGWYDEKQNSDINRSGMVALLASLAVTVSLTLLCFHKIPVIFNQIDIAGVIMVLLLPFYLFLVLLVFSVTALYNFKID